MSDSFKDQARVLAHSIPVCDLGSTAGIRAIAIGLREAWRMATEASDEELSACKERCRWAERRANEAEAKATLLEQTIQNGAEMIRGLTARVEAAEAKDVTWRLAYLVGVDEPEPGRKIVAIYDDGSAATMFWVHHEGLIDAEGDDHSKGWFREHFDWWAYIPDSVEFWCETRTGDPMTLKIPPGVSDAPGVSALPQPLLE